MRSIAGGMRWPIALTALLLALIGLWSLRGGSIPGPSIVDPEVPSPPAAACLDSDGNLIACSPRDVSVDRTYSAGGRALDRASLR